MRGAADFLIKVEFLRVVIPREGLDVLRGEFNLAETQGKAGLHRADARHRRVWRIRESEALTRGGGISVPSAGGTGALASRRANMIRFSCRSTSVPCWFFTVKRKFTKPRSGLLAEAFLPSTSKVPLSSSPGRTGAAQSSRETPGEPSPCFAGSRKLSAMSRMFSEAVCQPEAMSPPVMRA